MRRQTSKDISSTVMYKCRQIYSKQYSFNIWTRYNARTKDPTLS